MKITSFYDVRAGDRVTFASRFGERTGRAQPLLTNPAAGTVVVNMGGPYGTPDCVTPDNFVCASRKGA